MTSTTPQTGYFSKDARQVPLYPIAFAARLAAVPASMSRAWMSGRTDVYSDLPPGPNHQLSFWNLLELQALGVLRRVRGFDAAAVREALEASQRQFGIERLLVHEDLRSGPGLNFLDRYGDLVHLSRAGRLVLGDLWSRLASRVEFGTDQLGQRLRPWLRDAPTINAVTLDPEVAFGRPAVRGIRTDVLHSRFESGEDSASIAADFDLEPGEVEDAIRFTELTKAW